MNEDLRTKLETQLKELTKCEYLEAVLTVRAKGCELHYKMSLGTAGRVREFELSVFEFSRVEQYTLYRDFAGTGR